MGVMLLTSQEKWDQLKSICHKCLGRLDQEAMELNYKELQSNRGFMVHVTQAYPGMKLYLEGFHLYLETWQGGRDKEGWKVPAKAMLAGVIEEKGPAAMSGMKLLLLTLTMAGWDVFTLGPLARFTLPAPWFREDPKVLLSLAEGEQPAKCCIRSICAHTAFYSFGDASSAGFGATVKQPNGLACGEWMRRDLAPTTGSAKFGGNSGGGDSLWLPGPVAGNVDIFDVFKRLILKTSFLCVVPTFANSTTFSVFLCHMS